MRSWTASSGVTMRATDPLPFVPVMWIGRLVVLRIAEDVAEATHPVELQVLDPTRDRRHRLEVDVLVEPGQRVDEVQRSA